MAPSAAALAIFALEPEDPKVEHEVTISASAVELAAEEGHIAGP